MPPKVRSSAHSGGEQEDGCGTGSTVALDQRLAGAVVSDRPRLVVLLAAIDHRPPRERPPAARGQLLRPPHGALRTNRTQDHAAHT